MMILLLQLMGLSKKWPTYSSEEIARHCTRESLWIVVDNSVYDVTSYLGSHPGGIESLLKRGGGARDCSADMAFHTSRARKMLESFKIGIVDPNCHPSRALNNLKESDPQNSCCTITRTSKQSITEPRFIPCIKNKYTEEAASLDETINHKNTVSSP
ncbi:unnamed protein product [Phytomonas sp. EM1]|nr:unnamed protein product [Phytomonas sp. EM1]|eukprot:CCW59609.1 unnamed protein product [Phytomonas sp. isolate EM1]